MNWDIVLNPVAPASPERRKAMPAGLSTEGWFVTSRKGRKVRVLIFQLMA